MRLKQFQCFILVLFHHVRWALAFKTDRLSFSALASPVVNLVVVDGRRLLVTEAWHRALEPGTAWPRSDGHHRPSSDEVTEALLV